MQSEIAKVLELGVDTERIIFANPAKQVSHIRYAAAMNVRTMTFDNESELYKVKEHHRGARMVLRIRCDAKKAQCSFGMKFGCLAQDAPHLIAVARQLDIDLVGVSFHVGSGCQEPEVFERAIALARHLFDLAKREHGYDMTLLDLGGGFPGNRGSSINEIARVMNASLDRHFPDGCGVDVIAEPGRYYVASAFTLATRVHGVRQVDASAICAAAAVPTVLHINNAAGIDDPDATGAAGVAATVADERDGYMYYVNDGVYGSFNCLLFDHATVTPQLLEPAAEPSKVYHSSIWGPTCDSMDRIADDAILPKVDVGDWLVFEDMGAYTIANAGTFNGFPVPRVFTVAQQHTFLYLRDLLLPYAAQLLQFTAQRPGVLAATGDDDVAACPDVCVDVDAVGVESQQLVKSCAMYRHHHGSMPSSMSSASIVSLGGADTDATASDAVSTMSSDGDISAMDDPFYSDSVDFLADMLHIAPVM